MNFRLSSPVKLVALITVISLASCKKDSTSNNSNQSGAANLSDSSTIADNAYYDVLNDAFVGYSDNSSVWSVSSKPRSGRTTTFSTETNGEGNLGCAIYTIDDTVPGDYPKTLTMDFGAGCTSSYDGITRSGKITYVFSGPLLYPGTTASVTLDNYVVNGYGIVGTYTITNRSSEDSGIVINTVVTNGVVTYPNSTNYHYSHNKTYQMTAGMSTAFDITDDVYSITGNSAFSTADNQTLTFNVTTPLVKAIACRYISAGVVGFVYDQAVNGSINFGDGTCDNLATITVGNIADNITLR
jgi:hypothetical protein